MVALVMSLLAIMLAAQIHRRTSIAAAMQGHLERLLGMPPLPSLVLSGVHATLREH